jgi:hypothetical protein
VLAHKKKSRTGSRSGSGSAKFLLEAERPEAEAVRVEAEALKNGPLPHHCFIGLKKRDLWTGDESSLPRRVHKVVYQNSPNFFLFPRF